MIAVQTSLSVLVAVTVPAGGEMSGLTAHFLFGAKVAPPKRTTRGKHSGSKAGKTGGAWQTKWLSTQQLSGKDAWQSSWT
jgi:hypothetical protein